MANKAACASSGSATSETSGVLQKVRGRRRSELGWWCWWYPGGTDSKCAGCSDRRWEQDKGCNRVADFAVGQL